MIDNFKNLNTITNIIKRKIYNKRDSRLIIIMKNWENIVGKEYYAKTNPIKITKDQSLKVEVSNEILLDFKYSCMDYLENINDTLDIKDNILKILIVQKFF